MPLSQLARCTQNSFVFFSLALLLLHLRVRPFRVERENDMETFSLTFLVMLSVVLTMSPAPPFASDVGEALSAITLIGTAVLGVMLLLLTAEHRTRMRAATKLAQQQNEMQPLPRSPPYATNNAEDGAFASPPNSSRPMSADAQSIQISVQPSSSPVAKPAPSPLSEPAASTAQSPLPTAALRPSVIG